MVGRAGIDVVSLAQLRQVGSSVKHSGTGLEGVSTRDRAYKTAVAEGLDTAAVVEDGGDSEMARQGPSWDKLEQVGGKQGVGGGQGVLADRYGIGGNAEGVSTGVDGLISDMGGVWDGGGETALLRGFWGELWGWDGAWGCSGGSRAVFHHSWAVAHVPEGARVGDVAIVEGHIVDDMAGRGDV